MYIRNWSLLGRRMLCFFSHMVSSKLYSSVCTHLPTLIQALPSRTNRSNSQQGNVNRLEIERRWRLKTLRGITEQSPYRADTLVLTHEGIHVMLDGIQIR